MLKNLREPSVKQAECPFFGSKLFIPSNSGPRPGIVFLHGSGGGTHSAYQLLALFFAAHGYATLAFAYYGANDGLSGPRETLKKIELSKTYEAFRWLKESQHVNGNKMGLHGASRGAEQALLLTSLLSKEQLNIPDAVAVHAPSDVTWGAYNWDWEDPRCWLPNSADPTKKIWNSACGDNPELMPFDEDVAWAWKGSSIHMNQRIEVEKYTGPTFISHGTADRLWDMSQSQRIEATLKQAERNFECHYFEGEGHQLGFEAENRRNGLLLDFFDRNLRV